ncbi:MmcQ/YjbR family DNA-binding protein [Larkinella insperata]|uniref:MmcQ/YjbR family DNA-binding protein n=1 Tax=Larkinella insperata TaxID=332158 RepID=A0ABW3QCR2_9BACT|nr:MmcQ/YjbR family DNA-binding protein [Larkinella insperata]
MAVTYDAVCELALHYPGVVEGQAYGTPSLHVGRKLMARLREDAQTLVIKMNPGQRDAYFEQAPDTFFLTDHYRSSPVLLVDLATVRREVMAELVEKAWRWVASSRQLKAYEQAASGQKNV